MMEKVKLILLPVGIGNALLKSCKIGLAAWPLNSGAREGSNSGCIGEGYWCDLTPPRKGVVDLARGAISIDGFVRKKNPLLLLQRVLNDRQCRPQSPAKASASHK